MIRVLVVDDHPTFRQGLISVLRQYPEFMTVGQAANGEQAVALASDLQPDIVIMDICMPGGDGIAATMALQQKLPQAKVLIVTVSDKDDDLFAAIKAGAKGYLLKNVSVQELIDSIRLVAKGEAIVSPSMAVRLLNEFKQAGKEPHKELGSLSLRENEVLQLVAQGASNKEISIRLFISETTVKAHLRAILEKLHARNRAEAVAVAAAKSLLNK
jgi:two-component system NarL family response regulator